jgi:hypothetical protein
MTSEYKGIWRSTNKTEGFKQYPHFIHRTPVECLGANHTIQSAVIAPNGFVYNDDQYYWGYASGDTSIRHLFEDFGQPAMTTRLNMMIQIEHPPKIGKIRSGDLPFVAMSFEREHNVRSFTIVTGVIDNLTTPSKERYGLSRMSADSYGAECQRDTLITNSDALKDYHEYLKTAHVKSGIWGMPYVGSNIPKSVRAFRSKTLNLICSQLPISPTGSPDFKGIYGITATRLLHSSKSGWEGSCFGIRSLADIKIKINHGEANNLDEHRPAEALAKHLGITTEDRYRGKLDLGLYDTTRSDFEENIGGFNTFQRQVISKIERIRGDVSHTVTIESDGKSVGREQDDISKVVFHFRGSYYL